MVNVRSQRLQRAAWVIVVLVLAGCGAEPDDGRSTAEVAATTEPSTSTGTATSAQPTTAPPAPTPTATPLPPPPDVQKPEPSADMARDDQAGAVAAAEYYFALQPYAAATGDLGGRDAMSHPECAGCARERQWIVEAHETNDFAGYDALKVRQIWVSPPEEGLFYVTLELEPRTVEPEPSSTAPVVAVTVIQYGLRRGDGGWVVERIAYGGPDQVPSGRRTHRARAPRRRARSCPSPTP